MSTLPEPGSRVGTITGPWGFPASDNAGTVLCHANDAWYAYAVVLMDTGHVQHCMGLTTTGIGWYPLTPKAAA